MCKLNYHVCIFFLSLLCLSLSLFVQFIRHRARSTYYTRINEKENNICHNVFGKHSDVKIERLLIYIHFVGRILIYQCYEITYFRSMCNRIILRFVLFFCFLFFFSKCNLFWFSNKIMKTISTKFSHILYPNYIRKFYITSIPFLIKIYFYLFFYFTIKKYLINFKIQMCFKVTK